MTLLRERSSSIPEPIPVEGASRMEQFEQSKKHRLDVLSAQRAALLDARDNGTFDADLLASELANLDASQIAMEMRGKPVR